MSPHEKEISKTTHIEGSYKLKATLKPALIFVPAGADVKIRQETKV